MTDATPKHASEPRRIRKQLVTARINMARVLAIGEELQWISVAIGEASTGYQNHDMHEGQVNFWPSELFGQLSDRRTALREELRKMG